MNQKILYNFATRGRAEKFFNCLDNIKELSATDNYIVLAKLDDNDNSNYDRIKDYPYCIIVSGYSKNKIHAINRGIIPRGWDILVNMSDDMWFTAKGFDNTIRQFCGHDDFVHFPDRDADSQGVNVHDRISTLSIMGIDYYNRFGYVYHPDYTSLWCDNEATQVAKKLGRYKYVPEYIFEHRHPAWGKTKMDEQYKLTESFYHKDEKVFNRRKAKGFPV